MSANLETREAFAAWWDSVYHSKMTWMVVGCQFHERDEERYAIWLAGVRTTLRSGRATTAPAEAPAAATTKEWQRGYEAAIADASAVDAILKQALRLRLPLLPFPDPGAHSLDAYARAVHAAFCAIRFKVMDARAAITQAASTGAGGKS